MNVTLKTPVIDPTPKPVSYDEMERDVLYRIVRFGAADWRFVKLSGMCFGQLLVSSRLLAGNTRGLSLGINWEDAEFTRVQGDTLTVEFT